MDQLIGLLPSIPLPPILLPSTRRGLAIHGGGWGEGPSPPRGSSRFARDNLIIHGSMEPTVWSVIQYTVSAPLRLFSSLIVCHLLAQRSPIPAPLPQK